MIMLAPRVEARLLDGRPRSRSYQVVHRVADRFESVAARSFLLAIEDVKASINLDELASLIDAGATVSTLMGEITMAPIVTMQEQPIPPTFFARLESALSRASIATGAASAELIRDALDVEFAFAEHDPASILFARQRSAALVTAVTEDVRDAIQQVITAGAERGLTPIQQARVISEVVGLPKGWAMAPSNFADELRAGHAGAATSRLMADPLVPGPVRDRLAGELAGEIKARIETETVTEEWVERMQGRYATNLLHRRAVNIARTETLAAGNNGLRESWRQGVRQGALPTDVARHWIVTPDDRLRITHARVPFLNPQGVPLDGVYQTPIGPSTGPPLEVNCRCSEGLTFPGRPGIL